MKKTTKATVEKDVNPIDAHVGRQLRTRRTLMGLSQEDLANQIDLTFQQIQKYENGKNRVSASRLYELGICLDVPVAYFFKNADDFSEGASKTTAAITNDVYNSKETLELVKAYYGLKSPEMRKKLLKMLRSLSAEAKENRTISE